MLESQLETYFHKRVRYALGGMSMKIAPTMAGIPDRLVLLPEGRVFLVELKTETGRLSPIQEAWHAKAGLLRAPLVVLYGKAAIDEWIHSQTNRAPKSQDAKEGQ